MKNNAVLARAILTMGIAVFSTQGADRGPIQSGETHSNLSISVPSPLDAWTFNGQKGDRVIINAVTTSGALDTAIMLYPPTGTVAESSTHMAWGGDKMDCQLKASGQYTIIIEDNGLSAAGTYSITFIQIPGTVNSAGDPDGGVIVSGQTLNGTIQVPSDMDGFQFYGNAGDRVIINAVTTNGTLDTAIVLYPPTGTAAESSTHMAWGGDKMDYQLKTNGLYTIIVEDNGYGNTGAYNITLMQIPGTVNSAGDPDGGVIVSGQTLNGTIQVPSDMDGFQFYGNAGDRVIINAVTTNGTLDTAIVLYPPTGTAAESSTHMAWGGDKMDYQLKTNGLYTIIVEDNGYGNTGAYNITLMQIPGTVNSAGDPDGGVIVSGQTLNGTIQVPSDMDGFQFYGNAGDRVIINVMTTNGTLDTAIILYPPTGGAAENSTHMAWGGDKMDWQLKTNGLYTIIVEDNGYGNTGAYNITLMQIPGTVNSAGDPDGGVIVSGQTLYGTIQVPSDMDGFQFYGSAGDRVIINAVTTNGSLDTAIILYPPTGGAAENSTHMAWGGDKMDWQLKTNGLYTIIVEDNGLNNSGAYGISMTKIPSALGPGIYNPSPAIGATIPLSFSQMSWDVVPGATGYDLYFGENLPQPLTRVGNNFASPSFPLPAVEVGKSYLWHVVAHVGGQSVEGPYWWFRVDGQAQPSGTLQFKSATYTVAENGGSVRVYVSRTGGSSGAVSATYATANGTALAGSDFTAASGTLAWANGDTADKSFDVTVLDDVAYESSEALTVTLTGAAVGSPNTTTVTITDNDPAPAPVLGVTPASQPVAASAGSAAFSVANSGSGTLNWTAAVISGGAWARITSGASGANNGTVTVGYDANPSGGTARSCTVRVTAAGAGNSPADVTVTQAANPGPVAGRQVWGVSQSGAPGAAVTVPFKLKSSGNENALSFSVTYDPAVLGSPSVVTGTDAAAASLTVNTNVVGKVGVVLWLPAGQTFPSGDREFVRLSFTVAAAAADGSTTQVSFADSPAVRDVSDTAGLSLDTVWLAPAATVSVSAGYEGDTAPRPNGSGTVTAADVTQAARFAAGLDAPAASEFIRADCAPRSSLGSGTVTAADVSQAARYAAGLDPLTRAGGPSSPAALAVAQFRAQARSAVQRVAGTRQVILGSAVGSAGTAVSVPVSLVADGSENALSFSVAYDSAVLLAPEVAKSTAAAGASLTVNTNQPGKIGVVLYLPAGQTCAAGTLQVAALGFRIAAGSVPGTAALTFGDSPAIRDVADASGNSLATEWADGSVAVSAVPANPSATVGVAFGMALPDVFAGSAKVTVKGLPAGLKYNAKTAMIEGVPAKPGTYAVVLSAAGVPTETVNLMVGALPVWAKGTFNGAGGTEELGDGTAIMSVTALGKVTGKLAIRGVSYSFSAVSYTRLDEHGAFWLTVTAKARQTSFPLTFAVYAPAITVPDGAVPETLGAADGDDGEGGWIYLRRDVWKDAAATLQPFSGYYTATLPGNAEYGSGYVTFTVDKAGKVKVGGRLADGAAVSQSGTLILDEGGRVFTVLHAAPAAYKGGGLFGGVEFFRDTEGGAVRVRLLLDDLEDDDKIIWDSLSPQATGVYGEGFSREVGITGGWYSKTENLFAYYAGKELSAGVGQDAAAPQLTVGAARYDSIWWSPDGIALTPTLKSGVMTGLGAPAAGKPADADKDGVWDYSAANSVGLKIGLTRATGVFKGSFLAWFDYPLKKHVSKSLKFEGVLTPEREDMADGIEGRGFFLWPDKAVPSLPAKPYAFNWSYDFLLQEK